MRFVFGLICGCLLFVAYLGYQTYGVEKEPCAGLCGEGTECVNETCVVAKEKKSGPTKRSRLRSRRRRHGSRHSGESDEMALRKPTANELAVTTRGPSLRGADYVTLGDDAPQGKELSTDEIAQKLRTLDSQIMGCIEQASGDVDMAGSKVEIGLRIERTGVIQKVRVQAPALLHRAGVYNCIKPLVTSLHFRPCSRSTIMTYPYALH